MQKKSIVRLTTEERCTLTGVIKQLSGSSQKVRRAQMLLKANAHGPAWTDARIAEAFDSGAANEGWSSVTRRSTGVG